MKHFVTDYGVSIVGGCCGSSPEHIRALADALRGVKPGKRAVET
jgi:5-methyltetrahydrofolate--homocysteine methyltransferase